MIALILILMLEAAQQNKNEFYKPSCLVNSKLCFNTNMNPSKLNMVAPGQAPWEPYKILRLSNEELMHQTDLHTWTFLNILNNVSSKFLPQSNGFYLAWIWIWGWGWSWQKELIIRCKHSLGWGWYGDEDIWGWWYGDEDEADRRS